ncbi:hypothetical protein JMJ77_0002467 [Colletotrichum scovillei]|uniref:Uncharacterized protein n=1 Tax=Colletotrichum scovillei TaxID=1209932 RepID=A0A9P7R811_9PEZI|nr:hypothetical protein JMJ77_0002467 [Colletotrichum scovillei]KAG7070886.1 hypothetical protein JMJ76_0002129 [Colletotrichum scovillei]KAG7079130.1 hypothetical protein JMJ78_0002790 [Colletotrichum scovillei]
MTWAASQGHSMDNCSFDEKRNRENSESGLRISQFSSS